MRCITLVIFGLFWAAMSLADEGTGQLGLDASLCSIAQALGQADHEACRTGAPSDEPILTQKLLDNIADQNGTARALVARLREELAAQQALDLAAQAKPAHEDGAAAPVLADQSAAATAPLADLGDVPKLADGGYFIPFSFGSFDLDAEFEAHLASLAQVLSAPSMKGLCIRITGHTDSVGSAEFNLRLSQNRALIVASKLADLGPISPDRIQIRAAGEAEPLADISPADPLNRRVEFGAKDFGGGCSAA